MDAGNAKARQLNAAAGEVQELQQQLRAEKEGCSSMASSLTAKLKSSDTRTRELETHVGDLRRELDVSDRQLHIEKARITDAEANHAAQVLQLEARLQEEQRSVEVASAACMEQVRFIASLANTD